MCNCYVKWKITAVALLLYLADSVYGQNYSYVTTKYGVVRGQLYEITFPGNPKPEKVKSYDRFEYEQYVATYFGIPYAKPPVGELRFKKPQPPDSWKDTLNADTMPPACVQYSEYPFPWYDSDPGQSEDCLYLNVYAPYQNPPIRPVKLYIHGGGFSAGSNRIQLYDGFNDSVSFYNVPPDKNYDTDPNLGFYGFVDVVINYRLGAMGFLTSGTEDAPGNVGLYDMLSAVQWVRDNIAEFGGDPDDITLYGQGAGAIAVSLLSVSPLAHGLFKRAAMVGGSFFSIPKTQFYDNLRLSERLAEAVGCNGTNLLADPEGTVRCLRGETQKSLAFQFRIAQNTISGIIPSVCRAICQVLQNEYLKVPDCPEEWRQVSADFLEMWNFPMCLGALDGKHISILPLPKSGSAYFNYKHFFSIVLMALVDANLKFIYVDIGTNGRVSDGGVWEKCSLNKKLHDAKLGIPGLEQIPGTDIAVPHVIVADDAFPLEQHIMKPYPGKHLTISKRIFNYRLSRARRVSENAFGILSSRFRIYKSPILTTPAKAKQIVMATCCLHNFLRSKCVGLYTPVSSLDHEDIETRSFHPGTWRNDPSTFLPFVKRFYRGKAIPKEIRKRFKNYFNGPGSVSWQREMCDLH